MMSALIDLDHLMMKVVDADAALDAYARLGFLVSEHRPNGPMGAPVGGSRLILLNARVSDRLNYLELSNIDIASAHPVMKLILGGLPGPAMIVHASSDVDETQAAWHDCGLQTLARWTVDFPTTSTIAGSRFDILMAEHSALPFHVNAVRFSTLDPYRDEALRLHPNGAKRWRRVFAAMPRERVADVTAVLEGLYGVKAKNYGDRRTITPGDVELEISTAAMLAERLGGVVPAAEGPALCGFTVEVRDLESTRQLLTGRGVGFVDGTASIVVPQVETGGSIIEFVAECGT